MNHAEGEHPRDIAVRGRSSSLMMRSIDREPVTALAYLILISHGAGTQKKQFCLS